MTPVRGRDPSPVRLAIVLGALLLGASAALARPAPRQEPDRSVYRLLDEADPVGRAVRSAIEAVDAGVNLLEPYRALRAIPPGALAGTTLRIRLRYWYARARTAYELGRYDEVRLASRRLLALAADEGSAAARMYGLYYRATAALQDPERWDPAASARTDLSRAAALAAAESRPAAQFLSLLNLAKLEEPEAALRILAEAEALAREHGYANYVFDARVERARQVARSDPAEADRQLTRALDDRVGADRPWAIYGWEARLEVVWAARSREEAIEYSEGLLERIEARRRRQEEKGTGAMGFFSSWVSAYRRVIGFLLQEEHANSRRDLELAFRLSERMRARVLVDRLDRSGGMRRSHADDERARSLRQAVVALQRKLLRAEEGEVGTIRREIEQAMFAEETSRRADRRGGNGTAEAFVELRDAERALAGDEALLVFQVGSWTDPYGAFDGGSWLLVVTRTGTEAIRLEDARNIRLKGEALLGSLRRRDGSYLPAAVALHADLLRAAEARLPETVRHLIVVPDGPVRELPLGALRAAPAGPPLADRYRFSHAPSVTLWSRWRREAGEGSPRLPVAVADPAVDERWERLWPAGGLDLRPLPAARAEARGLLRGLGGRGLLLEGSAATEAAVKGAPLDRAGIVLFAAHAVVDERFHRRSAIVLAPGGEAEDGLLQPPEIAVLPLDGTIVSLSACQSAAGRAVDGEGLLSLARAFLQAGATSVLGNLWPVRDDEAADLFGGVYRELAAGRTLAAALQEAQRRSRERGDPAEAWAGVVLIGSGDARLRPGPAAPDRRAGRAWWLLLLALPLLLWAIPKFLRSRSLS